MSRKNLAMSSLLVIGNKIDHHPMEITRAPPTGAARSTFLYLILNCKQFTKLYILLTCQLIGVNTFYKCIEFQVNSFVIIEKF